MKQQKPVQHCSPPQRQGAQNEASILVLEDAMENDQERTHTLSLPHSKEGIRVECFAVKTLRPAFVLLPQSLALVGAPSPRTAAQTKRAMRHNDPWSVHTTVRQTRAGVIAATTQPWRTHLPTVGGSTQAQHMQPKYAKSSEDATSRSQVQHLTSVFTDNQAGDTRKR